MERGHQDQQVSLLQLNSIKHEKLTARQSIFRFIFVYDFEQRFAVVIPL